MNFIKTLLFFLILLNAGNASCQSIKVYDSIYTIFSGVTGKAKFEYKNDEDKGFIKHGPFSFTAKVTDTLNKDTSVNIRWRGTYNNNFKDGSWTYELNKHSVENMEVENFDVDYNLYSEKELTNAGFKNGRPEGEWTLNLDLFENAKRRDRLVQHKATFKNAKVSGTVDFMYTQLNGNRVSVKGTASQGLMQGEWIFEYTEDSKAVVESREYKNGFLIKLTKKVLNTVVEKVEFPLSAKVIAFLEDAKKKSDVVNQPVSLVFSDGYPRNSVYIKSQEKGNEIINRALMALLKNEEGFYAVNGLPLGTNRVFYELKRNEKKILENWANVEFEYRSKLNRLNVYRELNFSFDQNETIRKIDAWLDKQLKLMEYIKSWNNILTKNEIVYYNRNNEALIKYTENLLRQDTITYAGKEEVITYKQGELEEKSFLFIIDDNFKERTKVADSLVNLYERTIDTLKLNDDINSIKNDIKTFQIRLDSIVESVDVPQKYQPVYKKFKIQYLGEESYDSYSFLESEEISISEKKKMGDLLINDIRLIERIDTKLIEISENERQLDSLYTEYVFDPFTFTDKVPRRLKKKLYEIATEDIITELIERAASAETTLETYNYINQVLLVQQRLVFLHDKETTALEKQLRRKDPLEKKLQILRI